MLLSLSGVTAGSCFQGVFHVDLDRREDVLFEINHPSGVLRLSHQLSWLALAWLRGPVEHPLNLPVLRHRDLDRLIRLPRLRVDPFRLGLLSRLRGVILGHLVEA